MARIEPQIKDGGLLTTFLLPIHKFPAELLAEVFVCAVCNCEDDGLANEPLKTALRLSQVSLYWRQLALQTPRIWTMALPINITNDSAEYLSTTDEFLKRSCSLPIPISIGHYGESDQIAPALVNLICSMAGRWRNLDVENRDIFAALAALPSNALQQLQTLRLSFREALQVYSTMSLFLGATKLREVTLVLGTLALLPMPWAQLTDLNLTDFSPQNCLDILLQCTTVVRVYICTGGWDDSSSASATSLTTLPRLEELRVVFEGMHINVAPFFQWLALPALNKFDLDPGDGFHWEDTIGIFAEFIQRSPTIEHLVLRFMALSSDDLHLVLFHTPALTKLWLEYLQSPISDSFLEHLTFTKEDPQPLVPRLTELKIGFNERLFEEEMLEAMIRSRWWSDDPAVTSPSIARWERIEILRHLRHTNDDEFSPSFRTSMAQLQLEALKVDIY